MKEYRQLEDSEIQQLIARNCSAENWKTVLVTNDFTPIRLADCHFTGNVCLGSQTETILLFGGVKKECGIYHAHIHNCTIGSNVYINHVKNYLANYQIEDHVIIDNVDRCAVEGTCTFGNGLKVEVLDETGGRKIPIYDQLSAHLAYIMAFYKHRHAIILKLEKLIQEYTQKVSSPVGLIGEYSQILNCREIRNVKIGPYAKISGASILQDGSLNSNREAPVKIGADAILKNFIVSSGSEISEGAIVSNCFIGQGCMLSAQYSAQNSLFSKLARFLPAPTP